MKAPDISFPWRRIASETTADLRCEEESKQNDAVRETMESEDKLPEVFVACHQWALVTVGALKNRIVRDARTDLCHVENTVAVRA